MDEPTSNLDEKNINNFIEIIKNLKNKYTFIMITHDSSLEPSDKIIQLGKFNGVRSSNTRVYQDLFEKKIQNQ